MSDALCGATRSVFTCMRPQGHNGNHVSTTGAHWSAFELEECEMCDGEGFGCPGCDGEGEVPVR